MWVPLLSWGEYFDEVVDGTLGAVNLSCFFAFDD
jgi:hypothetical protein